MLRNTYLQQGNAVLYIAACVSLYDCIAVDIFVDMDIPAEATTRAFLKDCKRCLSGNGYIIYNAYFSTAAELKNFSELFYQVFPYAVQIKHDVNTIFISTSGAYYSIAEQARSSFCSWLSSSLVSDVVRGLQMTAPIYSLQSTCL
jgi:spermidine synthase